MQRKQKVPIVLAALLFVLAAVAEIAAGRSRVVSDGDAAERTRQAALASVDGALARNDVATALRSWQEAYELARHPWSTLRPRNRRQVLVGNQSQVAYNTL